MEFSVKRDPEDWFNDRPCQDAELNSEQVWIVKITSLKHLLDFAGTYDGLRITFDEHGWPVLEI